MVDDEQWHDFNWGRSKARRRILRSGRQIAIVPMLFTFAVIVGDDLDTGYEDRWCYEDIVKAVVAASEWDGEGEPLGWHRHPTTGRRRPSGDPRAEYVEL